MKRALLLLLSVFCALSAVASARPALSQVVPPPTEAGPLVTLDMTNVDTPVALDQLFKNTHGQYLVDETISDEVSLHIRDASFETALSALITAANPPLTYRFDGGGYHFRYLHPDNNQMYFIPLSHVSTRYVLARMRGALTGGLQPFDWQHGLMAVQINMIMADEQRNGFLVMGSGDGFNVFKEIVKNLDQSPSATKIASPNVKRSKQIGRH